MELRDADHVGGPSEPEYEPVALAFDIETASAGKLYHGGHEGPFVRLMGAQTDGEDFTWSLITTDRAEYAAELLRADFRYGHNVFAFDIPALARHCGMDYDQLCEGAWDLMALARLIDPPGAKHEMRAGYYGLDQLAQRLGHTGKSDDLKALALRHAPTIEREGRKYVTVDRGVRTPGKMTDKDRLALGFERIPTDDADYRDYLRGDLDATRFVRRELFKRVPNWTYAAREMRVSAIQHRMPYNGWRIDQNLLAVRVREEEQRRLAAVETLVRDYGLPRVKADGEPSSAPWATDGGRAALEDAFHQAGAEYLPRTKPSKGHPNGKLAIGKDPMGSDYWVNSAGKRVPSMLNPEAYGNVPAVVELAGVLAEATGASAKYAEIQSHLTNQGRVHGGIGEIQASGRWAMTQPSLTNLGKRGPKVREREPFVPEWGHVHLTCDLSQVDMRGLAALSQDPLYMALFAPGGDPHMDMAEVYFGERTKRARDQTKPINHGLGYGQSDTAIAARNGIPIETVKAATEARASTYRRLVAWTWEVRELGESGQLLDNGFGRLMRCDPERAYTQAPALMGQGCARDLMCEALLRLVALDKRVTAYLRAVVHDEVVLSVPEAEADYWRGVLAEAFTFTWRDVPILCEVSQAGSNWAACYIGES